MLGCCTRKFTQKYRNACFYEENSRHNACFIQVKKLPSLQYAQQVLKNLRADKFDHSVIKGQSKYRHGKVCKRCSVFICQKVQSDSAPFNLF